MRSSRSPVLAVVLWVGACGTDAGGPPATEEPEPCTSSVLTYANFGEPFLLDWCRGCHSSGLALDMRQNAPAGVDFDDLERVRAMAPRLELRATGLAPTMPPAAGPSSEERALLAEWLSCGAP